MLGRVGVGGLRVRAGLKLGPRDSTGEQGGSATRLHQDPRAPSENQRGIIAGAPREAQAQAAQAKEPSETGISRFTGNTKLYLPLADNKRARAVGSDVPTILQKSLALLEDLNADAKGPMFVDLYLLNAVQRFLVGNGGVHAPRGRHRTRRASPLDHVRVEGRHVPAD